MNATKAILISGAAAAGAVVCTRATTAALAERERRHDARFLGGKVVVITGASRGLGLALAEEMVTSGPRLS